MSVSSEIKHREVPADLQTQLNRVFKEKVSAGKILNQLDMEEADDVGHAYEIINGTIPELQEEITQIFDELVKNGGDKDQFSRMVYIAEELADSSETIEPLVDNEIVVNQEEHETDDMEPIKLGYPHADFE